MVKAKLNIKYKIVMYALGCYEELASKNAPKGLDVVLPKYIFINFIKKIGVIEKGERALYRNLELLEKKKYISYDNKDIIITAKGKEFYTKIKKEIEPFLEIKRAIVPEEIASKTKKLQTRFK
jgi:hypothetical protein